MSIQLNINIRSTGSESAQQVKMTFEELVSLFGKGYAEEVREGWEVRHPTKPYLKYAAM